MAQGLHPLLFTYRTGSGQSCGVPNMKFVSVDGTAFVFAVTGAMRAQIVLSSDPLASVSKGRGACTVGPRFIATKYLQPAFSLNTSKQLPSTRHDFLLI